MGILTAFFVFLFGSVIGSFLNVVILRTHEKKSLDGRSACPYCHHQLSVWDLIPVVSYLWLSGKCRYCSHKLSIQYPLVEFLTGALFALTFVIASVAKQSPEIAPLAGFAMTDFIGLIFSFFIISVLVVITVTDLRWGLIPDKIVLPASLVALLYQLLLFVVAGFSSGCQTFSLECLTPTLAAFGANILTSFGIGLFFFLLILGTRGKGMGGGDFKLSIFIGLSFGWPLALVAIFLGFLTGALGAVMLILLGKKSLKQTVPFGPFLALGALLTMLVGNRILDLYLKSMGL